MRKYIGVSWYCRPLVGPSVCVCRRALDSGSWSSAIASTVRRLDRSTPRCQRAFDRVSPFSTRDISVTRRMIVILPFSRLSAHSPLAGVGRALGHSVREKHKRRSCEPRQSPVNAIVSSGTHRECSNEYTLNTWKDADVLAYIELHVMSKAKVRLWGKG